MNMTRRAVARAAILGVVVQCFGGGVVAAQDADAPSIEQTIARAPELPPVSLYQLAGRLFAAGRRDEAVTWFYIAQIRSRFRLAAMPDLPADGEPALYAALMDTLGKPINEWAFGDVDRVAAQMTAALDWDAAHANATTPKAANAAVLAQVRGGLLSLRAGVLADKDNIRRQRLANGLVNR